MLRRLESQLKSNMNMTHNVVEAGTSEHCTIALLLLSLILLFLLLLLLPPVAVILPLRLGWCHSTHSCCIAALLRNQSIRDSAPCCTLLHTAMAHS